MAFQTVPVNDRISGPYVASLGQTSFGFDFPAFQPSEVIVTRERAGSTEQLDLNFDYSLVIDIEGAGGTVTLLSGALAGDRIAILGKTSTGRETFFDPRGEFLATEVNRQLNRLHMLAQEQARDLASSLRFPPDVAVNPLPADMRGKFVFFDANNQPLPVDVETLTGPAGSFTVGLVRATPLTGFVSGADAALVATDTLLQAMNKLQGQMDRRSRVLREWRDIRDLGVQIIDTTNTAIIDANTTAFQAALNSGLDIYCPPGVIVTGPLTMNTPRQRVLQDPRSIIKRRPGAANVTLITMQAAWQHWGGGQVDGNSANVVYSYNSSEFIMTAPDCRIDKTQLRNCQSMGVRAINGAERWTWEDIEIDGAGDFGAFCNNVGTGNDPGGGYANRIRVRDFGKRGNPSVGIGVRALKACHVTKFTVESVASYADDQLGVEFWTDSNGHDVSYGTIYGNGVMEFGISATGKRNRVSHVDVYDCTVYPFELMDTGSQVDTCRAIGSIGCGFALNMNPSAGSLIGDRTTFIACHATEITGQTAGYAAFVVDGISGFLAEGVDFHDCLGAGTSQLMRLVYVNGATVSNFRGFQTGGNLTPIAVSGSNVDISGGRLVVTPDANASVLAANLSGSHLRVMNMSFVLSGDMSNGIAIGVGSTEVDIDGNKFTGLATGNVVLSSATGPTIRIRNNYTANGGGWSPASGNILDNNTSGAAAPTGNQPAVLPTFTVATLPAAATWLGAMVQVTNEVGGSVPAFSDGTNWRRVTDRIIVS